jgi:thiamine pyrophosphate-dependent acetolactate synthase large subunit-like protein
MNSRFGRAGRDMRSLRIVISFLAMGLSMGAAVATQHAAPSSRFVQVTGRTFQAPDGSRLLMRGIGLGTPPL